MLNNHLRFTVLYHHDPVKGRTRLDDLEVEAFSIKHSYEGSWNSGGATCCCDPCCAPHICSLSLPACLLPLAALAVCADAARACCSLKCPCGLTGKKPLLRTCDPSSERVVTQTDAPQPWKTVRRSSTPMTSDSRCAR